MPTYLSDEDVFGPQGQQQQQAQPKYLSDAEVGLEAPQSMPADIAKSAGVGVGRGLIGLAGLPSDVTELGARGINYLAQQLPESIRPPAREPVQPTLGSKSIQEGVEQVTGPFYKPQTLPGKYAEQIGEFAPAVVGGPESLATRALTRAIVPGIVAETAGQVAEKVAPEYAPYARTVAGIAAGLRPTSLTKYAVPTVAEQEAYGTKLFQHPDVTDVRIDPSRVHGELGNIKSDLESTIDPELMKGTWSRLSKEQSEHAPSQAGPMAALTGVKPSKKADVSIDDLSTLRKDLSKIAGDYSASRQGEDRAAAAIAIGKIDDFLGSGLSAADVTKGDISKAIPILKEARDTWAAKSRVETADRRIASAVLRAATFGSGQNVENKIRSTLATIVDPDSRIGAKLRRGWNELELKRAEDIARGGEISNVLREAANRFSPWGHYGGALLAMEELYRGNVGRALILGVGLPMVARTLKGLGNLRTYQRAQGLSELLASRSPLAQQMRAQGVMAPTSPTGIVSGLGTYSAPVVNYTAQGYPYVQGRMKGGRVTKSFRCRPAK